MKPSQALAVVPRERSTIAERDAPTLTPAVKEAIQDLLVAYPPHPGEGSVDRVRLARIWARETSRFEPEIVTEACRDLLTNNPRNPFRPSVQDIVDRCERVRKDWGDRILAYYQGHRDQSPPSWSANITDEVLRGELQRLMRESQWWNRCGDWSGFNVSDQEYKGWRMAKEIGRSLAISRWPPSLLAEYGVLTGADFNRIQALVDAENERRERARVREIEERMARK